VEEYRAIAFESESEEEDDGPYVEDDYWHPLIHYNYF
jgi:hypothetical protein